jgi:hypothetical protein
VQCITRNLLSSVEFQNHAGRPRRTQVLRANGGPACTRPPPVLSISFLLTGPGRTPSRARMRRRQKTKEETTDGR